MEWIAYKLKIKIQYEKPVADEYFQLKCLPRIDETQRITELKEEILPEDCMVKKRMDDAKNQYVLGYMAKPHREFSYEAEGTVQVQKYNRKPENHEMLYRISSPYTEVGQNLGEWYGELNLPEGEVRGPCALDCRFCETETEKKRRGGKRRSSDCRSGGRPWLRKQPRFCPDHAGPLPYGRNHGEICDGYPSGEDKPPLLGGSPGRGRDLLRHGSGVWHSCDGELCSVLPGGGTRKSAVFS